MKFRLKLAALCLLAATGTAWCQTEPIDGPQPPLPTRTLTIVKPVRRETRFHRRDGDHHAGAGGR